MENKDNKITAYKGFDKDWKCRGFKFAVGSNYEHDGKTEACASGFHSCEYPLDVFSYYYPSSSVFAIVEAGGDVDRKGDDSKIASSKLTVKAEIGIAGLVKAAIEYTVSRTQPSKSKKANNDEEYNQASNTGYQSAASNTGYQSAASNTGNLSAASNTGDYSAASNTGGRSAASNTGDYSAASNTGSQSAASVGGKESVAIATGYESKAKGSESCAIVLVCRNDDGEIIHIRASKVGENGIKPDAWYMLDSDGDFIEVSE